MSDLRQVVETVLERQRAAPAKQSLLVALSGIDGAGKGYLGGHLVAALRGCGLNAVLITIDPWLNLPAEPFSSARPAEHFYANAIRFEEMFEKLVLPLKLNRSVHIEADVAEETATEFRRHTYEFNNVDVIVLEGIYLLRRDLRRQYDLSLWIECSFETALERALRRAQEGLPPAETVRAYQTIYFPAQLIHFALDEPWAAADLVIPNDPLLTVPDATANPWYLPAEHPTTILEMT